MAQLTCFLHCWHMSLFCCAPERHGAMISDADVICLGDTMQDDTFTLIVSAVGIGGALSGIIIGHFLTRSSQHRQWLRDNRKQEFKEVVASLANVVIEHMIFVHSQGSRLPQSEQEHLSSMKVVYQTLAGRIFIHEDLKNVNIPDRFIEIMGELRDSGSEMSPAVDKASEILEEIIKMARNG